MARNVIVYDELLRSPVTTSVDANALYKPNNYYSYVSGPGETTEVSVPGITLSKRINVWVDGKLKREPYAFYKNSSNFSIPNSGNFADYNGYIMVASGNRIYKSLDAYNWTSTINSNNSANSLAVFNSRLFWLSMSSVSYSTDLTNWNSSLHVPGDVFYSSAIFNGSLYVGASSPSRIYRSTSGDLGSWELVYDMTSWGFSTLCVHGSYLYAFKGPDIYRSQTGNASSWNQVLVSGEGAPFAFSASYGGYLYGLISKIGAARLYRSQTGDSGTWVKCADFPISGLPVGLGVFNGKLFIFCSGLSSVYSSTDGSNWSLDKNLPLTLEGKAMAVKRGFLLFSSSMSAGGFGMFVASPSDFSRNTGTSKIVFNYPVPYNSTVEVQVIG